MNAFTFSVPQNIIAGKGCLTKLPELVKKLGADHAFIISGPHLNRMGLVDTCRRLLQESHIQSDAFTETEGNPSVETVDKAAEAFQRSGAQCMIALGGGSPMDVAKAAGILVKYGGSITEYEGGGKVPGKIVPLIAVPTTAGTGSEVTAFSVITDCSRNYKLTVFSYELIPEYALLDPELLVSVPSNVAAACGVDAMVHAIEAYISTAASPFSDAMAEKALELIGGNIRRYVANRKDEEAAAAMLSGSMFAGIAFSWARLGNVHAMSHPVSAMYYVPHGVANAILLPVVMEYNALADRGRYRKIYSYITGKNVKKEEFEPQMLAEALRELNRELGIPESLRKAGVGEDRIEAMAADAMKSGNILVNPRSTEQKDVEMLYRKTL